jgi:hypothetical protein
VSGASRTMRPHPSRRDPSARSLFAALAATPRAADVATLSAHFRKSKNLEKQIGAVLASLARLGHIATKDGKHFGIRRVA